MFFAVKERYRCRHDCINSGICFGCGGGTWTSRPPGYEPDELPTALPRDIWCRKPESNRYEMLVSRDFKSRASASFAIPAGFSVRSFYIIALQLPLVNSYLHFFEIYSSTKNPMKRFHRIFLCYLRSREYLTIDQRDFPRFRYGSSRLWLYRFAYYVER